MNLAETIQRIHPRSLKFLSDQLLGLVAGRLWLKVLLGMALGVGVGVALGPSVGWVKPPVAIAVTGWFALPGQVFLALIQMIVVPLVFASRSCAHPWESGPLPKLPPGRRDDR